MEKKGLVEYRNEGRVFVYTARYTRESLVAGFLARVFDGKLIDLMESLLQQEDIDSQTQMKVRRIVAEALKKSQHHDP
jgi:predicted transcriptional regulator